MYGSGRPKQNNSSYDQCSKGKEQTPHRRPRSAGFAVDPITASPSSSRGHSELSGAEMRQYFKDSHMTIRGLHGT